MGESLVTRRSRRSTAGNNRYRAALAATGELPDEHESDADFELIDEEDAFDEDFASDSEKTASEDEVDAERAAQNEEGTRKQPARSQVDKVTAIANARLRATFDPDASGTVSKSPRRTKRKVSFAGSPGKRRKGNKGKADLEIAGNRHSSRVHTMQNTTATAIRLKETAKRRAAQSPKKRTEERAFTQAELIRRALDNEEGNVAEHRGYLKRAEEKRRQARVAKQKLTGPLVRWVSRGEDVVTHVEVSHSFPTANPTSPWGSRYDGSSRPYPAPSSFSYSPTEPASTDLQYPDSMDDIMRNASAWRSQSSTHYQPHVYTQDLAPTSAAAPLTSLLPHATHPSQSSPVYSSYTPSQNNTFSSNSARSSSLAQAPVPPQAARRERVAKNYIVHELDQDADAVKPRWAETMSAVFGDHVDWTSVKAYSSATKRPMSRIRHVCPITGRIAPYIDPRTGVPFADVQAYKTLTALLQHQFTWNEEVGAYTG
ncbi:YL1 nuclear protein-domain-containing protein [Schizophyllum fasciatum]